MSSKKKQTLVRVTALVLCVIMLVSLVVGLNIV